MPERISNQQPAPIGLDTRGFAMLKKASKGDPNSDEFKEAVKGASKQFEAVFLDMVMKSMRQSIQEEGLFSNEATKTFQGLHDQQLVQGLSAKGIGLAAVIEKQLLKTTGKPPSEVK